MPRSEEAYQATNAYRRELLALRDGAMMATEASWRGIDRDELDATFDQWLSAAAAATAAAGRQAISATVDYLERFVASELNANGVVVPNVSTDLADQGLDGRPLTTTLRPALFTVKAALHLRQPEAAALNSGLARATRTVAVEVMGTARAALDDVSTRDNRIVGWRRATSAKACGACLAAATGAIQNTETVLRAHAHCRCVKEPVIAGVRERFRRPSGQEIFDSLDAAGQDALFKGRGGAAKAQLIRDGDVPLAGLLTVQHFDSAPDDIVETPLAALRG